MHEQKIQVLQGTVSKLLRRGAFTHLKKALGKIHPADIAHIFRYFELQEQKTLLTLIPDLDRAADIVRKSAAGIRRYRCRNEFNLELDAS